MASGMLLPATRFGRRRNCAVASCRHDDLHRRIEQG